MTKFRLSRFIINLATILSARVCSVKRLAQLIVPHNAVHQMKHLPLEHLCLDEGPSMGVLLYVESFAPVSVQNIAVQSKNAKKEKRKKEVARRMMI